MVAATLSQSRHWKVQLTPGSIPPSTFWRFQGLFWMSVYIWRTAHTYAYGYGWSGADLRLISMSAAILITLGLGHMIVKLAPERMQVWRVAVVIAIASLISLIHTAADRLLYTAAHNEWALTMFAWSEYFEILSVNAWVFMSWTAFLIVILQFSRLRDRENAIQRLTQIAKDARLQTLMQQLNPHFLFNTLNSLSALIAEGRARDADSMLLQLSRFLRHVIDADQEEKTELQSEISIVEDFLAIQKVRFGDRLSFDISIKPDCQQALLPIMLLQPIVENAVKHGQNAQTALCHVSISAQSTNDRLLITISDSGPGFSATAVEEQGAGIKLIRARLFAHYGTQAQLVLSNKEDGGANVSIAMDFETAPSYQAGQVA